MKKKNTSLYLVALLAVAILIGVGYAALATTLNINGRTTIEKASWDVHFGNISANTTDVKFYASTDAALSSPISAGKLGSTNTLKYSIDLQMDGQTHNVTFDIVNAGTIDAKISSMNFPGNNGDITSNQYATSSYNNQIANTFFRLTTGTCKYSDGTLIKVDDVIAAGNSKSVTCSHHMKTADELTNSDLELWNQLSYSSLTGTFNIDINFVQAD